MSDIFEYFSDVNNDVQPCGVSSAQVYVFTAGKRIQHDYSKKGNLLKKTQALVSFIGLTVGVQAKKNKKGPEESTKKDLKRGPLKPAIQKMPVFSKLSPT